MKGAGGSWEGGGGGPGSRRGQPSPGSSTELPSSPPGRVTCGDTSLERPTREAGRASVAGCGGAGHRGWGTSQEEVTRLWVQTRPPGEAHDLPGQSEPPAEAMGTVALSAGRCLPGAGQPLLVRQGLDTQAAGSPQPMQPRLGLPTHTSLKAEMGCFPLSFPPDPASQTQRTWHPLLSRPPTGHVTVSGATAITGRCSGGQVCSQHPSLSHLTSTEVTHRPPPG